MKITVKYQDTPANRFSTLADAKRLVASFPPGLLPTFNDEIEIYELGQWEAGGPPNQDQSGTTRAWAVQFTEHYSAPGAVQYEVINRQMNCGLLLKMLDETPNAHWSWSSVSGDLRRV